MKNQKLYTTRPNIISFFYFLTIYLNIIKIGKFNKKKKILDFGSGLGYLKKINLKFKQKLDKNILYIKSNKKIYGPQPFLSIKTKEKKYFHDNFDIQKPFYEWTYTFDENTLDLKDIESIGWATNDSYGSTYITIINPKNKRFKEYEK